MLHHLHDRAQQLRNAVHRRRQEDENPQIEDLNRLYRQFQDALKEDPKQGRVFVVCRDPCFTDMQGQHPMVIQDTEFANPAGGEELIALRGILPSYASLQVIHRPPGRDVVAITWPVIDKKGGPLPER
jgi:hypothetical protein